MPKFNKDSKEEKVLNFNCFLYFNNTKQAVKDKFNRYYTSPFKEKIPNLIRWWVDYYKQYPILYKLALELTVALEKVPNVKGYLAIQVEWLYLIAIAFKLL